MTFDQIRHHLTITPAAAPALLSWFRLCRGRELPDFDTPHSRAKRFMSAKEQTPVRAKNFFNLAMVVTATLAAGLAVNALVDTFSPWLHPPTLSSEAERRRQVIDLQYRQALAQHDADRARQVAERLHLQQQQVEIELARLAARTGKPLATAATAKLASDVAELRGNLDNETRHAEEIEARLKVLDRRFSGLESAIMADPQKAVAIPLLRRDFDALQQQTAHDFETVHGENNRLYDLMKLLIGLMGLISFGLLGTAVGSVFKRDTPAKEAALRDTSSSQRDTLAPRSTSETA
jgi:hypothetical protein